MNKILENNVIESKLTEMRDKNIPNDIFAKRLEEISAIMAFESEALFQYNKKVVETPTGSKANGMEISKEIMLVPILRAGKGMLNGFKYVFKDAKVGEIGVKRNEKTFEITTYKYEMPNVKKDINLLLLDPMLATGNSACEVITMLKKDGYTNISFIALVGVQEGIDQLNKIHPDVNILLAKQDEKLNDKKYIIPGLGDAGDRLFGEMED